MIHTPETHQAQMPDCSDPDCEFHHPEVMLDEGWTEEQIAEITAKWKAAYPELMEAWGIK